MDALTQQQTAAKDVLVELVGAESISAFEPLWKALYAHHAEVARNRGPMRSPEESWVRRRAKYQGWLAEPDAFAVLAKVGQTPVGYAVIHLCDGSESWQTSERIVSVETMSLLPQYRHRNVGDLMARAIFERCVDMDVSHATVTAIAGNDGSVRFFERYGFVLTEVTLMLARPDALATVGGAAREGTTW